MTLDSWKAHIPLFRDGYGEKLLESVRVLRQKAIIYPDHEKVFHAFERTPFDQVKVVILGQDPYHGQGQAHGLAFSVPQSVPAPPSLRNILKEVIEDTGKKTAVQPTDLSPWADQGVLLLNTLLTVEAGQPMSHKDLGWEALTSQVIAELSDQRVHLVFLLWGSKAQDFSNVIAKDSHLVLTAAHPSPLSAYRGFFGCRHFSIANAYLKKHGIKPIRW
ncbi:MAG: uracil-DNA glycosylase [Desulfobacteraceae bacterium]|jgi:uracil-DNA glycosylase